MEKVNRYKIYFWSVLQNFLCVWVFHQTRLSALCQNQFLELPNNLVFFEAFVSRFKIKSKLKSTIFFHFIQFFSQK